MLKFTFMTDITFNLEFKKNNIIEIHWQYIIMFRLKRIKVLGAISDWVWDSVDGRDQSFAGLQLLDHFEESRFRQAAIGVLTLSGEIINTKKLRGQSRTDFDCDL